MGPAITLLPQQEGEMQIKSLSGFLFSVLCLFIASNCFAAEGHGSSTPRKIGILLVAFGTSEPSAQVAFENIDRKVRAAYPAVPVRWAYTSHIIRKKLAGRGKVLDSPEVALARMMDEKFTHVAVQSLHTIPGAEYDDLERTVNAFRAMGGFQRIILGYPLMATQEDMAKTVSAILSSIPAARGKKDAVVLMGHGTHHPANAFYAALMFQLQLQDPNIFVGTVEGYPEIGDIKKILVKKKIGKAYLMPFMSVAGDHAKNDMAGDEADSWKSILAGAGIGCVPILKGTAEYDSFVDIWISHIDGQLRHFN
jgi:sirohydrochlorin cobaltochelatase